MLSDELAIALDGATRSIVTIDLPPLHLVVQVVLPGKQNIDRDYRCHTKPVALPSIGMVDPILRRVDGADALGRSL